MEGQKNDEDIQKSSLKSSNEFAKNNNYTNFLEEWKSATNVSLEFDKMLLDLRKYGFSIITGLITAGSFLGFSFSDTSSAISSNIIHIGVINVTMILVVILFWLDILYQNYLYASVFRTRILELFRLRYRLSIYISGLYTKSSMNKILNLIYGGFLIGVFILGLFVIGIAKSESNANTNGLVDSILTWITQGQGLLILSFILCGSAMIAIYLVGKRSLNKKLEELMDICDKYLNTLGNSDPAELSEDKIIELEREIYKMFPRQV